MDRSDETGERVGVVTSAHWYEWARDCEELKEVQILLPEQVKLLAKKVTLEAIRSGNRVHLELTASFSPEKNDTAKLQILAGQEVGNCGTQLIQVCDDILPESHELSYSCLAPIQSNYRVLEIEL